MSAKASQVSHALRLQLRVIAPPTNVSWAVQLGRTELLGPVERSVEHLVFEIPLELLSTPDGEARVRGAAVQGPRSGRFLYLASGTRAGDVASPWNRRAKISLETLPFDAIRARPAEAAIVLVGEIDGTARDGGPACASVPLRGGSWAIDTSANGRTR